LSKIIKLSISRVFSSKILFKLDNKKNSEKLLFNQKVKLSIFLSSKNISSISSHQKLIFRLFQEFVK
jgi:hypothetical protein